MVGSGFVWFQNVFWVDFWRSISLGWITEKWIHLFSCNNSSAHFPIQQPCLYIDVTCWIFFQQWLFIGVQRLSFWYLHLAIVFRHATFSFSAGGRCCGIPVIHSHENHHIHPWNKMNKWGDRIENILDRKLV